VHKLASLLLMEDVKHVIDHHEAALDFQGVDSGRVKGWGSMLYIKSPNP